MTDFEDPPRWADAPGSADPRLTSLFRAAREDVASDRELEALAAQLGPALGPGASAPMAVKASLLAKLGAGVALVVLGAGGVYYAHTRAQRQASSPGPRPALVTASQSAPAGVAVAAPSSEQPANPVEATPAPAAASPPPAARAGNRLPSAGAREGSVALDEATILERARADLAANPAHALALTSEHAKLFPHGVLAQEREVIAIAALRRLGRTAAAEWRAEAFDRSYPHSAHQHTVDAEPAK
jgi:hypothetical protein